MNLFSNNINFLIFSFIFFYLNCRIVLFDFINGLINNKSGFIFVAFIKSFFSICGVVCKKRATSMKPHLLFMRAFMKSRRGVTSVKKNTSYY
jgi:hypothetical protein